MMRRRVDAAAAGDVGANRARVQMRQRRDDLAQPEGAPGIGQPRRRFEDLLGEGCLAGPAPSLHV